VRHIMIYPPCNCEVNRITHFGVISLFSSNFQNFNTFRPLSFLPYVRFLILLTVFELLPKTCNFTICSIFSNSGHVGWCTASQGSCELLPSLGVRRRRPSVVHRTS
jgi:hypothetical protein